MKLHPLICHLLILLEQCHLNLHCHQTLILHSQPDARRQWRMKKEKRCVQKLKEANAEAEKHLSNLVHSPPGPSVSLSLPQTLYCPSCWLCNLAERIWSLKPYQTVLEALIAGYQTNQNGHQHGHLLDLAADKGFAVDVSNPDGLLVGLLAFSCTGVCNVSEASPTVQGRESTQNSWLSW